MAEHARTAPPRSSSCPRSAERPRELTLLELTDAFTTYGADLDLACGTLRQSADEIQVVLQAMIGGCAHELAYTALRGIAQRMAVAAKLASGEATP